MTHSTRKTCIIKYEHALFRFLNYFSVRLFAGAEILLSWRVSFSSEKLATYCNMQQCEDRQSRGWSVLLERLMLLFKGSGKKSEADRTIHTTSGFRMSNQVSCSVFPLSALPLPERFAGDRVEELGSEICEFFGTNWWVLRCLSQFRYTRFNVDCFVAKVILEEFGVVSKSVWRVATATYLRDITTISLENWSATRRKWPLSHGMMGTQLSTVNYHPRREWLP